MLDVVFIAVLGWGVAGAAIATVVSQVASALLTLRCVIGSEGMPWHVSLDKMRMEPGILGAICTIGIGGGPKRHVQPQQHGHPKLHEQLWHRHHRRLGRLRQN